MKVRGLLFVWIVLCLCIMTGIVMAQPSWIQYNERVVGENDPGGLADVVNRPGKTIWANVTSLQNELDGHTHTLDSLGAVSSTTFDVEHNADGTHDFTIPSVGESALVGTGTGSLASVSPGAITLYDSNIITLWAVVSIDTLTVAESFHKRVENEYSYLIWNFGKGSDNKLFFVVGDTGTGTTATYTSQSVVFDADTLQTPLEVGVSFDRTADTIIFWYGGNVEASQIATTDYTFINGEESISLGDGLDGKIFTLSIQGSTPFLASSRHSPLREGLSQCFKCLSQYDMDEGSGGTLTDQKNSVNLTVAGTWLTVAEGY